MASPIKTVVLLVQQNRSFDHMMGWMKFLNREINGITGSESNPLSTSRPNANRVHFNNQAGCLEAENYPSNSFEADYEQVFGVPWSSESSGSSEVVPTMEGFVQQAERAGKGMSETVMNGLKPDAIPVYKELVAEFAVCDRWFSSVPASDQPNRLYVHSATSHGSTSNDVEMVIGGYPQKTIFDSLDEAGFTFGIYYQLTLPTTLFYR